ncbi:PLD nuclease N-terminal domain-containing protein [Hoeflea sp. WL0058]|uniref:PLD nuclease N-terminal domain-containing protein n=1 Tax=Flavimaribacter sediminis TaxID=2865987 RepID=A0AAE2ZJC8_9HYPH|nr:PLD nuclease N-terminal domain-containing protein [Flavimaribacter sediminis]MBW8635635.1 PLD nuclease N-terminal domain-containing protein [Flavimaribacter sediminis]
MEFLFGILVLILDIYAIIKVIQSGATTGAKVLWILGIIIFPIVGFIVWLIAGPKAPGSVTV